MASGELSALSLISSTREFSGTEQRIVDYILDHREEAPTMTAAQLARRSGTSEATISRFCKHLGFDNYRSFQFSLGRDLTLKHDGLDLDGEISLDNVEDSLKSILATKMGELEATLRGINGACVRNVVKRLAGANVIQIAAVGNTNSVALDATFKFSQLGLRCTTHEVNEIAVGFALTMQPKDALLVISNSGRSQRLMRVAQAAKNRGACVIAITGDEQSPLARLASYVLRTVNHEALLTTGDFAFSKISAMAIIETLYYFLLHEVEDGREHISRYEELIQPDKDVE
ncbi:MurR/RpiR family transcriptional regulator [Collinsella sp. KGMB02528]|uniref:MurR/RpiR family transcriptional regulator n=1 Tax=Collinsella acetigenes TaxID=2713419 RepID=A0A7X9UBL2_9ACTN|nr:MurR/RpiR family transcriptional regulator [Collinsella acetigenes]NMF55478.1 MurR/RpiR family transcriptional regulator [Collinsella acetigenes]